MSNGLDHIFLVYGVSGWRGSVVNWKGHENSWKKCWCLQKLPAFYLFSPNHGNKKQLAQGTLRECNKN